MSTQPFTIHIDLLFWLTVPLLFCIGFFLWWRRTRHWSFGLLSVAAALSLAAQACGFVAKSMLRLGKSPEEIAAMLDNSALVQASVMLHLAMGVLLLVGGFGLVVAARDEFLMENAKRNIPSN